MHLQLVSCATKLISSCTKPELIDSVILRQATFPIVLLLSGCTLLSTWRTTLVSFIAASLSVLCTCPPHVCINLFDHCVLTAFFKTGFQIAKLNDISWFFLGAKGVCVLCRNSTRRALLATQPAFVFFARLPNKFQ